MPTDSQTRQESQALKVEIPFYVSEPRLRFHTARVTS